MNTFQLARSVLKGQCNKGKITSSSQEKPPLKCVNKCPRLQLAWVLVNSHVISKSSDPSGEFQICRFNFLDLSLIATAAEVTTELKLPNRMHENCVQSPFCPHELLRKFYVLG